MRFLLLRVILLTVLAGIALSARLSAQDITSTTEMERQILEWTNQERTKVDAPPLKWNERLGLAARLHSDEMAKQKDLSHQVKGEPVFTQRIAERGARFSGAAENVGFADDAETLQSGWMHSPGHRANLLNPAYTEMGVGIVRAGNRLWATEDFATFTGNLSSEDFERAVGQQITSRRHARGMGPLTAIQSPELRRLACADVTSGGAALGAAPHGNRQALSFNYTAPKSDQLPQPVVRQILDQPSGGYSIGACASPRDSAGMSTYRVLIVFYR